MFGVKDGFLLLYLAVLGACVLAVIIALIFGLVSSVKSKSYKRLRIIIISFCSIIIAAFAWVLNFGWLRVFLTMLLIPTIHGVIYFISNVNFSKYTEESSKVNKLNIIYIVTYLSSYLLLSDGSGNGELYFFFGLIKNNVLSSIADYVSGISVLAHIVFFFILIFECKKLKKNKSDN